MADLDVVVVGAGFAGIYAVHALRCAGLSRRCRGVPRAVRRGCFGGI